MWADGIFGEPWDTAFFLLTLAVAIVVLRGGLRRISRRSARFPGAKVTAVLLALGGLFPCWWVGTLLGLWPGVILAESVAGLGFPIEILQPIGVVSGALLLTALLMALFAATLSVLLTSSHHSLIAGVGSGEADG